MIPDQVTKYIPSIDGKHLVNILDPLYPKIETSLSYRNTFELLIATILSAQCTDLQVNKVTTKLFRRYPDPAKMSKAKLSDLENLVKPTGFFHVKAKRIREISRRLMFDFRGKVPETMDELLTLDGVGRKTANIVLSAGYGRIEGIAVDTHVFRLSRRIGLSVSNTPEKIERDLMLITPKEMWPRLSMLLILHGRRICFARNPVCEKCSLTRFCQYYRNNMKLKRD